MDHVDAGEWQVVSSAMKSAESILSREPWFRWPFEIRFHAARAKRALSKEEGLCLLEKAAHCRARRYIIAAQTILAKIAIAKGDTTMARYNPTTTSALIREHVFSSPGQVL